MEDMAHLYISYEALKHVLKLPDGVEIVGLAQKPEEHDAEVFRLVVRSPEFVLMKEDEETGIKRIKPEYHVYEEDGHKLARFMGFIDMQAEAEED